MSRRNIANYSTFNTVFLSKLDIQGNGVALSIFPYNSTIPSYTFDPVGKLAHFEGDFEVTGTAVFHSIAITEYEGGIFNLSSDNTGDVIDIGLAGKYVNGTDKYAGLVRDASDTYKRFTFFEELTTKPGTTADPLDSTTVAGIFAKSIDVNDGTVLLPSIAFNSDLNKDTGFYRAGENSIGVTAGGISVVTFTRTSPTLSDITLNSDTILKLLKIDTVDDSILSNSIYTGHTYIESSSAHDKWFKYYSATSAGTPAYAGSVYSSATDYFFMSNVGTTLKVLGRTHSDAINIAPDFRVANTEIFTMNLTTVETKMPFVIPDGSLGTPAIYFANDSITGIYRSGSSGIGIVGNGINLLNVANSAITAARSIYLPNGTAAAPALAFTNNTDLGLYRVAADILGIAIAGANKVTIDATSVTFANNTALNVGTSGNGSALNVYGPLNAYGGFVIPNGSTFNIGTSGTTSTLNVYGNSNTYAGGAFYGVGSPTPSSATLYTAPATTTSTAAIHYFNYFAQPTLTSAGVVTVPEAYTLFVAGPPAQAGSTTIINPFSMYIPSGRVFIGGQFQLGNGTESLPAITFASNPGLNTGFYKIADNNIGVSTNGVKRIDISDTVTSFTTGHIVNVGTSGTTSSLNVYGTTTVTKNIAITAISGGSTTAANAPLYVAPSSTALSGTNNYYYSYYAIPATTSSTTGSTYTVYIDGAPSGGASNYALYVSSGVTRVADLSITGTFSIGSLLVAASGLTVSGATTTISGPGSATASSSSLYIAPATTTVAASVDQYLTYMTAPVLTSASAFIVPKAATLYIAGAPTQGGSTTITNPYSIYVNSGVSYFGGVLTAAAGITIPNGQTFNVGTSGTTSTLNVYGTANIHSSTILSGIGSTSALTPSLNVQPTSTAVTGTNNYYFTTLSQPATTGSTTGSAYTLWIEGEPTGTISNSYAIYVASGRTNLQTLTTVGLITATAGVTVTTGQTVNVGTSGTTSPLNVFGLITGSNGLTISSGTSSLQAVTAAGLITANLGLTVTNGQTANIGTSGTTSPLNVYGLITGYSGLTINSGTSSLQAITAAGLITAQAGLTVTTGQTTNIGTSGTTSPLNVYGLITGYSGLTVNSGTSSLQAVTAAGLITANLGLTVANGQTLDVGTSGTTSPLNVYGLITGANGLTISSGTSSLQAITAAGLITANLGLTVLTGQTANIGTSGTTSPLNVYGLITGTNGLTISSGTTSLQAVTAAGLITANLGLTVTTGQTANIGTSGTTSPLNVFGLITGNNGLTILSGTSSLQAVTAAGLITAQAGLTVTTGQTANIGTSGTTSPLNVYGLITGSNGLTISSGTSSLQAITAAGLITANLGLTVTNGQTLNVGTSGTSSTLNVYGTTNLFGTIAYTAVGNTTPATGAFYVAPSATTATAANYYFSSFAQPTLTSGGAITVPNAYTVYIADAPAQAGSTTITNAYALYIASGATRLTTLNATGLITGINGLTISSGTSSLQAITAAGLITANAGLTIANGQTANIGTSGTTSSLNVYGTTNVYDHIQVTNGVINSTLYPNSLNIQNGSWTTNGNDVFINANTSAISLRPTTGTSRNSLIVSTTGLTYRDSTPADIFTISTIGLVSTQAITAAGLITANAGLTVATGQTLNVGTASNTSPLNVFGLITGNNGLTISSGTSSLQAITAAGLITANAGLNVATGQTANIGTSGTTSPLNVYGTITAVGLITGQAGLTITTGQTANIGTSGTTSPLNVFGLITGNNGLTISSGTSNLQAVTTAGLITANAGITVATGQTANIGTSGTTSPLNVYGLITGSNGLTISSGTSSLQVITAAGLITAQAGLTVTTGQTLNVGTSGTTSPLNVFGSINATGLITAQAGLTITTGQTANVGTSGTTSPLNVYGLITGTNGLTISSGTSSLQAVTAAGLITANAGLTVTNGQTTNIGTSGTTSPLNVFGLITGNNGLTISSGTSSLQAITAAGLITANAGLNITNGQTLNVGTSGTSSILNVNGQLNTTGIIALTGVGNTTSSTGTLYIAPSSTTATANSYFFSSFVQPTLTSGTAITVPNAYTIYIAGAPAQAGSTTITNPYALYVAAGLSRFQDISVAGALTLSGGLTIPNGNTLNVGTSGTTSPLNVFGLITGNNGLTISSGTSSLQAVTTAGLITANAGLTVTNGQTLNVGTSGTTSPLNVYGLITGINGLTISSGTSSLQAVTAAGLITANAGLTIATGQTANIGTTGTTSPLNVFGLITGSNGLTISSGTSSLQAVTAAGLITANAGINVTNGQTLNVGTSGTGSTLNIYGASNAIGTLYCSGAGSATASTGTFYAGPVSTTSTAATYFFSTFAQPTLTSGSAITVPNAYTVYIADAPAQAGSTTITNPYALYVASGLTRLNTLTAAGLITGTNGLTISSGTTSLQALIATGITNSTATNNTNIGYVVKNGNQQYTFGIRGDTSNVFAIVDDTAGQFRFTISTAGLVTASAGLTVSGSLITAQAGLTVTTGQTTNIGTSGTTSPLNVFGLITGSNGLTISSGTSSLQAVTTAGLITANLGLTVTTGQTANIGTSGTTSPLNVFGLITGSNGLTISSGTSSLQAITAAGLITANLGLTVTNGQTLNVGTSGITSTLNVFGPSNHSGIATFTGVGNTTAATGTLYSAPTSTTATATNYFFNSFAVPTLTSAGAITVPNAYTMYIAGAPAQAGSTTITNPYALYVAAGITRVQDLTIAGTFTLSGGLTIPNGNTLNVGTSGTSSTLNVFGTMYGYTNIYAGYSTPIAGERNITIYNSSNDSAAFAALRFSNDTVNNGIIFLNSSARTADGNVNTMTMRNDAGDLLLQSAGSIGVGIKATTGNVALNNTSYLTRFSLYYAGSNSSASTPYYNFGLQVHNSTASGSNERANCVLFTDGNSTQGAIGAYRSNYTLDYRGGLLFLVGSQPGGYTQATPSTITEASNSLTEAARLTPAGRLIVNTSINATTTNTGAIVTPGGLGIGQDIWSANLYTGQVTYTAGFKKGFLATSATSLTLSTSHNIVECTAATSVTITLPTISGNTGQEFVIIRSGAGTVTINTNGTEKIDDGSTTSISLNVQYDRVTLVCGSTQWYTV